MSISILDFGYSELKERLTELGEKPFRADQLFAAAHKGKEYYEMSEIPKSTAEKLTVAGISAQAAEILETFVGADAKKYLVRYADKSLAEAVFMPHSYGNTVCISTEIGCPMGCVFCASGEKGLFRKLTAGEMVSTVAKINRAEGGDLKNRAVTNIVMMGMGEPLDNYQASVKFLRLVSEPKGLNISPRNISLSTAGIVPKIRELADEQIPVNLTISLHAPNDDLRERIMPVNKSFRIADLLSAARYYFDKTGRRINIEYVMIDNLNSSDKEAAELCALLKGLPCHVNLINLNRVSGKKFSGVSNTRLTSFRKRLEDGGISVTVRRSLGGDIEGACGQLKRRYEEGAI